MNAELKKTGCIAISGRIDRKFLYLYVDFRVEVGIIRTIEFIRGFHHPFVVLLWLEFLYQMCYTVPERWCSDG